MARHTKALRSRACIHLHSNPFMQSLLATLANIDFEYEHEIRRVGRSSTEAGVKNYLMERLRERHHERRSPYVRELAALERSVRRDWA